MTPDPAALLVADGDIPTTRLLARELREGFRDVEVRIAKHLFGAGLSGRPIIVSRLCYPRFSWLPEHLSRRQLRYAYFLDDNFWEITHQTSLDLAAFFQHPATVETLDVFVRHAGVVVCWSSRLRDYVAARHPGTVTEFVRPGFDVATATKLLARRDAHPAPAEPRRGIRIGYPTTARPRVAPLLVPVVRHFLERYGDKVMFEFIGWMPEGLSELPNVVLHPWIADYDAFLEFKLGRRWDVGIAPLIGDSFDKFKTDNKYREYAGCGIPGVYSCVSPFAETVRDGVTGLLVGNEPGDWIGALERMVRSPELRASIAAAASDDVRRNYDLRVTGRHLVDVVRRHTAR
jgi:glycosyltransferase involved in cell wall biosynthesis